MKVYTVKELHAILTKAMGEGRGSDIVLVPNNDEDIDADYATLGCVEFGIDSHDGCLYLDGNAGEEEEKFWEER